MNKLNYIWIFCIVALCACQDNLTNPQALKLAPELPETHYDYMVIDHEMREQVAFDNTPVNNTVTNGGATLGRVLFYDKALSLSDQVSCSSCHLQQFAFSDNKALSHGFDNRLTKRNSPMVSNMRFSSAFFWDMREQTLENQVIQPINDHIEMGIPDNDFLVNKLKSIDYYPELFEDAFGSEEITIEKIGKALAQFIRCINSSDSKFDQGRASDFENFTALEKVGMETFEKVGCNSCHTILNQDFLVNGDVIFFGSDSTFYNGTGQDVANIGLDLVYEDQGLGEGRFKVPSLRNLAFTAPYMHDGRFQTLDEVVEHYQHGVKDHQALDFRLANSNEDLANMTAAERNALIAFLMTLNDTQIITAEELSDPF